MSSNWQPCKRKNSFGEVCGRPGKPLFTSFECTGPACSNYSQSLRDIWDEETKAERAAYIKRLDEDDPWGWDTTKPSTQLEEDFDLDTALRNIDEYFENLLGTHDIP